MTVSNDATGIQCQYVTVLKPIECLLCQCFTSKQLEKVIDNFAFDFHHSNKKENISNKHLQFNSNNSYKQKIPLIILKDLKFI